MTLNGAITELVLLSEHPMMPVIFRPAIQKVIETISELEAQPGQRWIPVTERLPKESCYDDGDYVDPSDSVLVFTRYKTYYISRYWGHRTTKGETSYVIPDWMDLDEYISDAVVAWMPLPKPWEGEEK